MRLAERLVVFKSERRIATKVAGLLREVEVAHQVFHRTCEAALQASLEGHLDRAAQTDFPVRAAAATEAGTMTAPLPPSAAPPPPAPPRAQTADAGVQTIKAVAEAAEVLQVTRSYISTAAAVADAASLRRGVDMSLPPAATGFTQQQHMQDQQALITRNPLFAMTSSEATQQARSPGASASSLSPATPATAASPGPSAASSPFVLVWLKDKPDAAVLVPASHLTPELKEKLAESQKQQAQPPGLNAFLSPGSREQSPAQYHNYYGKGICPGVSQRSPEHTTAKLTPSTPSQHLHLADSPASQFSSPAAGSHGQPWSRFSSPPRQGQQQRHHLYQPQASASPGRGGTGERREEGWASSSRCSPVRSRSPEEVLSRSYAVQRIPLDTPLTVANRLAGRGGYSPPREGNAAAGEDSYGGLESFFGHFSPPRRRGYPMQQAGERSSREPSGLGIGAPRSPAATGALGRQGGTADHPASSISGLLSELQGSVQGLGTPLATTRGSPASPAVTPPAGSTGTLLSDWLPRSLVTAALSTERPPKAREPRLRYERARPLHWAREQARSGGFKAGDARALVGARLEVQDLISGSQRGDLACVAMLGKLLWAGPPGVQPDRAAARRLLEHAAALGKQA